MRGGNWGIYAHGMARYVEEMLVLKVSMIFTLFLGLVPVGWNGKSVEMLRAQERETVTIQGRVIDGETRQPIPQANLALLGTNWGAATNDGGEFIVRDIRPGRYIMEFTHINYVSVRLDRTLLTGARLTLLVEMFSQPIELSPVEIIDTVKTRFGGGAFSVGREEILQGNAETLGDVIRQFVPRAWVREEAGNLFIQLQLRTPIRRFGRRETNPLVILDGVKIGTSPIGLAHIVAPSEIRQLQVVVPPDAEALYGPEARYGVLIIDTMEEEDIRSPVTPLQKAIVVGGGILALLALILFL